jgi:Holliday junction resolvase RusA-like endonuclease
VEGETLILTFTVPWSALCSDNRKFKFRFVLSKQYREAKLKIGTLAKAAAKKANWPLAVVDLGLYVRVREPDRRRRDLNFSKNLKDGITDVGGVWVDDRQVRDERWVFDPAEKGKTAGATITIWRLTDVVGDHGVVGTGTGIVHRSRVDDSPRPRRPRKRKGPG